MLAEHAVFAAVLDDGSFTTLGSSGRGSPAVHARARLCPGAMLSAVAAAVLARPAE